MYKFVVAVLLISINLFCVEVDDKLLNTLSHVESNHNVKAYCKSENAIGILQIREIYVEDVNRIYGTTYKHEDCWSKEKSYEIAKKYLTHYGKRYKMLTGNEPTYEVYARIHNGGLNGWRKQSTNNYWNKVKSALDNH